MSVRLLSPSRLRSLRAHPIALLAVLCASALIVLPCAAQAAHGKRRLSAQQRCGRAQARGSRSHAARACGGSSGRHAAQPKGATRSATKPGKTQRPGLVSRPVDWHPVASAPKESSGGSKPAESAEKVKKTHKEGGGEGGLPQDEGNVVTDPIDPRFLTKLPFGTTSFWMQPWRAYFDTWPSSTLLDSLGINFNVSREFAEPVAQLLHESGFTLARREVPWADMSYEDPTEFDPAHLPHIETIMRALKKWSLRPLLLLNANSGEPGPAKVISLETLAQALPGAMTVRLNPASAAEVVPGKTGFTGLTWGEGPDVLISSVNAEGVATLSRPLRDTLPAGAHRAMTLRYAPFGTATLANGEANPVYEETMQGWLQYVAAVNKMAASIFGAGNYDLEVWNELTFGSQFLNSEHYYQPADARTKEAEALAAGQVEPQDLPLAQEDEETAESSEARADTVAIDNSEEEAEAPAEPAEGETESGEEATAATAVRPFATVLAGEEGPERRDTTKAVINDKVTKQNTNKLLKETIAFVRNPANGISANVGVSDGFASQTPFPSGALAPQGETALSKHLYNGSRRYPAEWKETNLKPLNALGVRDTESHSHKPLFIPQFQSDFPEYFLTALSTETLVRDIAPITTEIYGLQHGREVGPQGGAPVQKWMTEYNLASGKAVVMKADGVTPAGVTATAADRAHLEAKAMLRDLVAMINKGLSREYYFAAAPGPFSLIGKGFYEAVEQNPGAYPGTALGGETLSGFREMLARFQGPGPEGAARKLQLDSIAQEGDHAQFVGDGTAAHPTLYDRDVLAVLPFQSAPNKFVIPVYVMTRDLDTLYQPELPESDVTRFDLPPENFTIKLSNLPESTTPPTVSAYDPLRREATPAQLLSREGSSATFQIAATDYPRLLTIEYH